MDKLDEYREIHDAKYPDRPMTYDIVPAAETPFWLTMLPFIVLIILTMAAFYYFMYMQSGGGKAMNVGRKSKKTRLIRGVRLRLRMWQVRTKRKNCGRLLNFEKSAKSSILWAHAFPWCPSGRTSGTGKRCWPAPVPVRQACRSLYFRF